MHVRAPSATLCAPNNPYSYSNHGLSPWKKTSIVREDGLRVLCRNFLHSFLSRSISDRFRIEKNSATPFIIFLPIEFFRSSKVKYRQDLFETYSDFFEILFRRFFFLFTFRSVQLYITQNGVKVRRKIFAQKSGKFVRYRSTINSIPPRSKSLISFDF